MNLAQELQNFNQVETARCTLIENGGYYEMFGFSSAHKVERNITNEHTLLKSETDNARLAAHWAGFVSNVEGA